MTNELFRGVLSDIAKIYTTLGYSKLSRDPKELDKQKKLFVNRKVIKEGIQARTALQSGDYSYVIVSADDRLDLDYLAFLLNSSPWKILLGDGLKFLDGLSIPTSIGTLKKLPVYILSNKEQSACAFLNTLITTTFDAREKSGDDSDDLKIAFRYLLSIRDTIALEIMLDGLLNNPEISVLSAWMEKKAIYDSTEDKNKAFLFLLKSIFSSNDELRDRMNKMRLYIDENTELICNQFPK